MWWVLMVQAPTGGGLGFRTLIDQGVSSLLCHPPLWPSQTHKRRVLNLSEYTHISSAKSSFLARVSLSAPRLSFQRSHVCFNTLPRYLVILAKGHMRRNKPGKQWSGKTKWGGGGWRPCSGKDAFDAVVQGLLGVTLFSPLCSPHHRRGALLAPSASHQRKGGEHAVQGK